MVVGFYKGEGKEKKKKRRAPPPADTGVRPTCCRHSSRRFFFFLLFLKNSFLTFCVTRCAGRIGHTKKQITNWRIYNFDSVGNWRLYVYR